MEMTEVDVDVAIEATEVPETSIKTEKASKNIDKSETDSQFSVPDEITSKLLKIRNMVNSEKTKVLKGSGTTAKAESSRSYLKRKKSKCILCLPGQQICATDEYTIGGDGTYLQNGFLYASLIGFISVRKHDEFRYVEVISLGRKTVVPLTGDIVTARVLLVNNRFAKCSILCVGDHVLDFPYRAILRKEEVRATEKDRTEMYKSFRAGDVILARVLPQTELSCYQLTTAENELGVVIAVASENTSNPIPMVPIGWTEMQCPNTLIREFRKVAKVAPASAINNI